MLEEVAWWKGTGGMAGAYGSSGLASVLSPKVQRAGPSSVKACLTSCSNFRSGFSDVQIARRAGLVPPKKLEYRASSDCVGMLKPLRLVSPVSVLSPKAPFSRKVSVRHPYERAGRERRLTGRSTVSCNARGPVDALEEKRNLVVKVVEKEIVLSPRTERAERFKRSTELKESLDVVASDTFRDATLIMQQEQSEVLTTPSRTEVFVSGEGRILSSGGNANNPQTLQQENSVEFLCEHYVDNVDSVVEKYSSHGNSTETCSTALVDRELHYVDAEDRESSVTVDDGGSLGQETVLEDSSNLRTKKISLGIKAAFVSKPHKKRSAGMKVKEAVSGIKKILAKDGEVVTEWARNFRERTGVDRIIAKDVGAIQEAISWVKELALPDLRKEVTEIVALRILEDPSSVPSPPPEWPTPQYRELSGRALLAADLQTLSSYQEYFKEVIGAWRVPLQLSYNPDYVAKYFNRRPHLLVFRFLEVAAAFSSVAFQGLIDGQKVSKDKSGLVNEEEHLRYTLKSAAALKDMLVGLGPTFIKVAQSLSSRPDLIGSNTAKVLSELQDRLAPYPTAEALAVIEQDLGLPLAQVFSYLSEDPVAAASFGQVYRGRTVDGHEVAVKVQRPDLLFTVARDIYILRLALGLVRKVAGMNSDISVLADELGRGLFGELDYNLEAANARIFEIAHASLPYVRVPKTLSHLTTQRVLTMEWIDGFRPSDLQLIAQGKSLNGEVVTAIQRDEAKVAVDNLVKNGVESSLVQLLETGVMHADPHPGNLLYTNDGKLTYLDFGLICRLEKRHQAAMLAAIAHLVNGEWAFLANDLGDMDVLKPTTDRFALRLALERVFGDGPEAVVKDGQTNINFGQVTGKLWQIALKFRLRLPPYYTLVLRSLASLEGIALSVDPDYKVFASAYPYVVNRLLTDNSRPTRQVLQSLVLNDKKELRWDRIASIVRTSRGEPSSVKGPELRDNNQPSPSAATEETGGRKNISVALLCFALSRNGSCVRRILVEADTKSLGETFVSDAASKYRRMLANVLSEAFYRSGLNRLNVEQGGPSSASSLPSSEGGARTARGPSGSGQDLKEMLFGNEEVSPDMLKNRRLWFLMKVLAGKLQGSPFLRLKVGWTVMTILCYAAAVALHRLAITLSDKLVKSSSDGKLKVLTHSPARQGADPQREPSLSVPVLV